MTILILTGITLASAVHIYFFSNSNWSLISKFLVCAAPIGIWVVIEESIKQKKNGNEELNTLIGIRNQAQVSIVQIDLNRIANLEEYEDEGDLYLIETKDENCIYLWDVEYLIMNDEEFPSDQIEVYVNDAFSIAIDKKIKCLGSKLTPIIVKGENKWTYFGKAGFPGDLQIEEKAFDKVIEKIKA